MSLCEEFSFLREDPEEDKEELSVARTGISVTRDFLPVMYILGSTTSDGEIESKASIKVLDIHLRCSEMRSVEYHYLHQ